MFPSRYYNARMFAPRYYPKLGADAGAIIGRVRITATARRPSMTATARRPSMTATARRPSITFTVEE
jgi:hypothetical protein